MTTNPNNSSSAAGQSRGLFSRIGGFVIWVVTGFGLLGGGGDPETIVVYAVHQSFFLWALVATGFAGSWAVYHWPASAGVWGWVYLWILLYTLVTVLFDVSTFKFLLWLGVFSFIWLAARYLEDLKHMMVVTSFLTYFRSLRPQFDPGFATVVSWVLLPAWLGSLFETFSWGRKTFTPNSIEERFLGEGCEVTDRAGLKFRTKYRDIFETVLGLGAGDLEAVDGTGRVVKSWPNILFLAFIWNHLDAILHQRAALVDNTRQQPVEVENVK